METVGARLRSERVRLGMSQTAFGGACGAQKTSQINYEADRRHPDSAYLEKAAALGIDVLYVITGQRTPPATLTAEEAALLDAFRHASTEGRSALTTVGAALAQPGTTQGDDCALSA